MKIKLNLLILFVSAFLFSCSEKQRLKKDVVELLQSEIITRGEMALTEEPATITLFRSERSLGTMHDFYSEGDYWWPDPTNPEGAYIRRDGETNPDNFVDHRHAMIRFSTLVGDLTSAWLFPYIKDKSTWTFKKDVMHWEEWPVAHPALLFSIYHTFNREYFEVWKTLEHDPTNEEVIRNLPIRHPVLWL